MPDQVSDEYGGVTSGWQDMFTIHAQITPRLGGETVEAARLAGRQPVEMRVRNTSSTQSIRTDWKATDIKTNIEYNVRSVADPLMGDTQHGQWIVVMAEAGVAI